MFMIRKPSATAIDAFLASQRRVGFSYREVGSTQSGAPAGYAVDHNRICLGCGVDVFLRASELLTSWRMFNLGWIELFRPDAELEAGATVAVLVHHFGFWSLNACRVVYVFKEERSCGFAYGTLQ